MNDPRTDRLIAQAEDTYGDGDEADLLAEAYERGLDSIAELRRIQAEDREADLGTSYWKEDR